LGATNEAFTIPVEEVISYTPMVLEDFIVYGFEWIDNFHFLHRPEELIGDCAWKCVSVAESRYKGLAGLGVGSYLLWLPPFVFPLELKTPHVGIMIWHVKQIVDGVSFLLLPIELHFLEFE